MRMPECSCVVSCRCPVYPSEDPQKVVRAVSQIFEGVTVTAGPDGAGFRSDGPEVLQKIRDATNSRRSHKLYRRHLESNLHGDSTWLYLNKQAACAGTVALCSGVDESPLGPIKVTIQSPDIEEVIRWLASDPAAPQSPDLAGPKDRWRMRKGPLHPQVEPAQQKSSKLDQKF